MFRNTASAVPDYETNPITILCFVLALFVVFDMQIWIGGKHSNLELFIGHIRMTPRIKGF